MDGLCSPFRKFASAWLMVAALQPVAGALAADGRIEIGAADVAAGGVTPGDAPGFPVTLAASGSYVLSGDLVVPANTDGIRIEARDVSLDLNGFAIRSTFVCTSAGCSAPAAGAAGISAEATGLTVRGGTVRGFGGDCISIVGNSRLQSLWVRDCGANGIESASGSIVLDNRVARVGRNGITFGTGLGIVRGNDVSQVRLDGFNEREIVGGVDTGGNRCDAGGCSAGGKRRFYLTGSLLGAVLAPSACLNGFHMASAFELLDPGALEYASSLGMPGADAGTGPPAGIPGRVRTGQAPSTVLNCNAWTSANPAHTGTQISLRAPADWNTAGTQHSPWQTAMGACSAISHVWCVED